jgi:putative Mn2+ efflux pump MntP
MFNFLFFFNSILIGVGLAMDAFSASLANGLGEPGMSRKKMCGVAGVFAVFQALMPLIGWLCVHTVAEQFTVFQAAVPWIALLLLGFIGGKMLVEGIKENRERRENNVCTVRRLGLTTLLVQGVATSIDALSVGFTISDYNITEALVCVALIAVVTFIICLAGILLGKRFGTALAGKSEIFGGAILIFIGIEIFVSSFI